MVPLLVEALIPDPLQDVSAIAARQTIELERDPAHIDFQEIRPVCGAASGLPTRRTITHSSVAGRSRRGETDGDSTRLRRRHAAKAENGDGDVPPPDNTYSGGTGAGRIFVLAKGGEPLMPCHPARARELLTNGRAVVARHTPTGRGSYARTTPDRYGFPRLARARQKRHHGFAAGDLVHASISRGKWAGTWTDASPSEPPGNTASARRGAAAPCPTGTFDYCSVPTDTRTATGRKSPNKWVETSADGF
ncbi:RRXRR domain-containing protein [Streptomyces sp900116325]|uniref:RRXRR domain-containing protein n=1 Tax=Streptomyces sp. 900116325 TaxID=3154295 RepID=A0ABV2U8L0_9ACTN